MILLGNGPGVSFLSNVLVAIDFVKAVSLDGHVAYLALPTITDLSVPYSFWVEIFMTINFKWFL
jgi:hypothetical protein